MRDITISDDILKQTTECEKDFACLSSETRDVCKAEFSVMRSMVYVECLEEASSCSYRDSFGASGIYVCTCPVRIELRDKYGI